MYYTEVQLEEKYTALVWFRDDLRIHDHEALSRACTRFRTVIGVYFFDPRNFGADEYGFARTGSHRARFLIETVENLRENLYHLGIPLLVLKAKPESHLPDLVREYNAASIFTQKALMPREVAVEQRVAESVGDSASIEFYSGQFLMHPDDAPFGLGDVPTVFSVFRKNVEQKCEPRDPFEIPELMDAVREIPDNQQSDLSDLFDQTQVVDARSSFPFRGGETQAQYRTNYYLWDTKFVTRYKETRNDLRGVDSSTKFSPWLANGSLSPRFVCSEIRRFEKKVVQNGSTYWVIFQLLWRDFFKYFGLANGESLSSIDGISNRPYSFNPNPDAVKNWIAGNTGEPLVDACMIELRSTGWLSNRGRHLVASYFCNELEQDWRIGAAWFASQLIDYDAAVNLGNWMFAAGVAADPRQQQWINPETQAEEYDPDGEYQNLWLGDAGLRPAAAVVNPV